MCSQLNMIVEYSFSLKPNNRLLEICQEINHEKILGFETMTHNWIVLFDVIASRTKS